MSLIQETVEFRDNLVQLQSESLSATVLFAGGIGYLWLMWMLWPVTGDSALPSAWIGACILLLSTVTSHLLKRRHMRAATQVVIWGILGAIACAVYAFRSLDLAYLFILPVIFATVLLKRRSLVLVASAALLFILMTGLNATMASGLLAEVALPMAIIALATIASWISAHNLHVALAWVWTGYESARYNEKTAREQQAELRRVLKALDEATYRIERTNYMLAVARDQAEEARQLKQQFAQTISHELRTPLNLIVGFTELMLQSPEYYGSQLPPAYLRDLSTVHRNASHLQALVSDVLDLARIETAHMSLLPAEVEPATLLEETVATARSLVEARGLALYAEVESNLPQLWVDPIRIRQVLFNLLNNAARFTEKGSVSVRVYRQAEKVIFAVTDTGIGIAPKDLSRLFQEFHQLDGGTRRRHGGAGLGLAISKRFVEMHGGRIWVESQVGRGSTFYFELPVNRTDLAEVPDNYFTQPRHTSPKSSDERILLLITRSPSAAALLARYLIGYRTVVVNDLHQGQFTSQQLIPQAVVIDTACQPLTLTDLEELGQSWHLSHIPFIAYSLSDEKLLRRRLAVNGYLVKPISRDSLWDMLRQFGENVDTVLVIDDDRDFVRLLTRMLDSPIRRYQVISAYNGHEGLAMLDAREPDLVLLDLALPDIDGFNIVERIRSNPKWQYLPIVTVSAQDEMNQLGRLSGTISVSKAAGIMPGELITWLHNILDTTTHIQGLQQQEGRGETRWHINDSKTNPF